MSSPDDRSPIARASTWVTRIMTISLEMVLPGLAGYWLDQKLNTVALFMLIGFALGCTAAALQLIRLTRSANAKQKSEQPVVSEKRK